MAKATLKAFTRTTPIVGVIARLISEGSINTTSLMIQSSNENTGTIYIGDVDEQIHELEPGESMAISDVFHNGKEAFINITEIYYKGDVMGETLNITYTEIK